jgi:hypothetical protein
MERSWKTASAALQTIEFARFMTTFGRGKAIRTVRQSAHLAGIWMRNPITRLDSGSGLFANTLRASAAIAVAVLD